MSNEEKLFKEFQLLSLRVKMLGGIVQNAEYRPTEEQLLEWFDSVNSVIGDIHSAKEDVSRFFRY
ncbi:hypothetical protein [Bacillus phage vB_BanS-Thrax3]|nr:hypothetical protein [Bacillus phage vB_BanS-Thrax3]